MAKYSYETIFAIPKDFEKDEFCGLTIYNRDTESFKGICIRNDKPYGNHIGLHTLCVHKDEKVPEGYKTEYKRVVGKEWKPPTEKAKKTKGIFDHIVSEVTGPRDVGLTTYLYNKDSVAIRIADLSGMDWVTTLSEKSMSQAKDLDKRFREHTHPLIDIILSQSNRVAINITQLEKLDTIVGIGLYDLGPKHPEQTEPWRFLSKGSTVTELPYKGSAGIATVGFFQHFSAFDGKEHRILSITGTDETDERKYWWYQPGLIEENALKPKGCLWISQGDIIFHTSEEGEWEGDIKKAGRGIVFARGEYDNEDIVRMHIVKSDTGKYCVQLDCLNDSSKSNTICGIATLGIDVEKNDGEIKLTNISTLNFREFSYGIPTYPYVQKKRNTYIILNEDPKERANIELRTFMSAALYGSDPFKFLQGNYIIFKAGEGIDLSLTFEPIGNNIILEISGTKMGVTVQKNDIDTLTGITTLDFNEYTYPSPIGSAKNTIISLSEDPTKEANIGFRTLMSTALYGTTIFKQGDYITFKAGEGITLSLTDGPTLEIRGGAAINVEKPPTRLTTITTLRFLESKFDGKTNTQISLSEYPQGTANVLFTTLMSAKIPGQEVEQGNYITFVGGEGIDLTLAEGPTLIIDATTTKIEILKNGIPPVLPHLKASTLNFKEHRYRDSAVNTVIDITDAGEGRVDIELKTLMSVSVGTDFRQGDYITFWPDEGIEITLLDGPLLKFKAFGAITVMLEETNPLTNIGTLNFIRGTFSHPRGTASNVDIILSKTGSRANIGLKSLVSVFQEIGPGGNFAQGDYIHLKHGENSGGIFKVSQGGTGYNSCTIRFPARDENLLMQVDGIHYVEISVYNGSRLKLTGTGFELGRNILLGTGFGGGINAPGKILIGTDWREAFEVAFKNDLIHVYDTLKSWVGWHRHKFRIQIGDQVYEGYTDATESEPSPVTIKSSKLYVEPAS